MKTIKQKKGMGPKSKIWKLLLTAGTSNFFTSSTALFSLISALFWASSTVIKTCKSSLRCSQLGLPLFCSSWKIYKAHAYKFFFSERVYLSQYYPGANYLGYVCIILLWCHYKPSELFSLQKDWVFVKLLGQMTVNSTSICGVSTCTKHGTRCQTEATK